MFPRTGLLSAVLSTLLPLAAAGCGSTASGTAEPVQAAAGDLIGGSAGTAEGTPMLYINSSADNGGCSAVMIGRNQVLTAAHCVVASLSSGVTLGVGFNKGDSFSVTDSSIIGGNSNFFVSTVVATDLAPDFESKCASGCNKNFSVTAPYPSDIAIVTLATEFPRSFGNHANPYTVHMSGGTAVEIGGYGCEVGVTGPPPNPRRFKYANTTVLDPSGPIPASFKVADVASFSQNYFLTLGQNAGGSGSLCPGDSGGPVFDGDSSNALSEPFVTGVNAYYFFSDGGQVSDINVFARLDSPAMSTWIPKILSAYDPPKPTANRGDPVNVGNNPVSLEFPLSTVTLLTPNNTKNPSCTGAILSPTQILTAAHCQVNASTTAYFFPTGRDSGSQRLLGNTLPHIDASFSVPVAVQPGVVCNPDAAGSVPRTCYSTWGSGNHYADLAILTLESAIPAPYTPVVLGPVGSYTQKNSAWWEVATGTGGVVMQWAPVYELSSTDVLPGGGFSNGGDFYGKAPYGVLGDSGGPIYQYASNVFPNPDPAGTYNIILMGITSNIGACAGAFCESYQNSYTSVTHSDNFSWIAKQIVLPPKTQIATFGASL